MPLLDIVHKLCKSCQVVCRPWIILCIADGCAIKSTCTGCYHTGTGIFHHQTFAGLESDQLRCQEEYFRIGL